MGLSQSIENSKRICEKADNRSCYEFFPLLIGSAIIRPAIKDTASVMPDLIRHPVFSWMAVFAGMLTIALCPALL
jgi:hypothetical protein